MVSAPRLRNQKDGLITLTFYNVLLPFFSLSLDPSFMEGKKKRKVTKLQFVIHHQNDLSPQRYVIMLFTTKLTAVYKKVLIILCNKKFSKYKKKQ